VASITATRMWRVYKESGRPWPTLCEDDVIDYMVMEAVAVKAAKEAEEQAKTAEREKWKKDREHLKKHG
jgi:hypothetical protein